MQPEEKKADVSVFCINCNSTVYCVFQLVFIILINVVIIENRCRLHIETHQKLV